MSGVTALFFGVIVPLVVIGMVIGALLSDRDRCSFCRRRATGWGNGFHELGDGGTCELTVPFCDRHEHEALVVVDRFMERMDDGVSS